MFSKYLSENSKKIFLQLILGFNFGKLKKFRNFKFKFIVFENLKIKFIVFKNPKFIVIYSLF